MGADAANHDGEVGPADVRHPHEPPSAERRIEVDITTRSTREIIDILQGAGIAAFPLDEVQLLEEMGLDPFDGANLERPDFRAVADTVAVLRVADPDAAIDVLDAANVRASRQLWFWTQPSHWTYAPGSEARRPGLSRRRHAKPIGPGVSTAERPVYVVDTGLVADHAWRGWLPNLSGEPETHSDVYLSHGTFVGATIAQLAPAHKVHVFACGYSTVLGPKRLLLTAGMVAMALARVLAMMRDDAAEGYPQGVVNMSLGTQLRTEFAGDEWVVEQKDLPFSVETALTAIRTEFPDVTFVAAGGNDGPVQIMGLESDAPMAVYPAWRADVEGAGVTDGVDDESVWYLWPRWDEVVVRQRQTIAPPPWIDWLAPGLDLLGPVNQDTVMLWSGSSFAAAVRSGIVATGSATPAAPLIRRADLGGAIEFGP